MGRVEHNTTVAHNVMNEDGIEDSESVQVLISNFIIRHNVTSKKDNFFSSVQLH